MDYPALTLLMQGYLHQDWNLDYPDVWAVVDDYLASDPNVATELSGEIAILLDSIKSEDAAMDIVVVKMYAGYYPPGDGYTVRDWLAAVLQRARGATISE